MAKDGQIFNCSLSVRPQIPTPAELWSSLSLDELSGFFWMQCAKKPLFSCWVSIYHLYKPVFFGLQIIGPFGSFIKKENDTWWEFINSVQSWRLTVYLNLRELIWLWSQINWPMTDNWIKIRLMFTVKHNSTFNKRRRRKILLCATTWMELEGLCDTMSAEEQFCFFVDLKKQS